MIQRFFTQTTSSDNSEINTGPSDTSDDNDAEESNNEPAAKAKRAYRTKHIREQEKREERGSRRQLLIIEKKIEFYVLYVIFFHKNKK